MTTQRNRSINMYAHFQDFVDAYVGPFATRAELDAHVKFVTRRGDAAAFLGVVDAPPANADVVMTPGEDLEFYDEEFDE